MGVRIYFFSQEGCMGCEEQKPINQEITTVLHIPFEEFDAVKHPEYIKKYQLRVTPTILVLVNGEVKARFEGVVHREELEATIRKYL